jgi:hypothetical protein
MVKSGVSVLDLITEFFSSNSRPRLTGVVDRAFSYLRLTGLKDSPDSFFFFFYRTTGFYLERHRQKSILESIDLAECIDLEEKRRDDHRDFSCWTTDDGSS